MNFDTKAAALYNAENTLPSPPSIYSQESFTGISELNISQVTNALNEPSPEDVLCIDQFLIAALLEQDIFALLHNEHPCERNKTEINGRINKSFVQSQSQVSTALSPSPQFAFKTPTPGMTPIIPTSSGSGPDTILPSVTQLVLIDSAEGLVASPSLIILVDDSSSRPASTALDHGVSLANDITITSQSPNTCFSYGNTGSLLDAALPSSQVLLNLMIPSSVNNSTPSSFLLPPPHFSGLDLKHERSSPSSVISTEARSVIPSLPTRRNAQQFDDAVSVSLSDAIMDPDQLSFLAHHPNSLWLPTASKDSPDRWFDSPLSLAPTVRPAAASDINSSGSKATTPITSPQSDRIPDSPAIHFHETSNSSKFQHTPQHSQSTHFESLADNTHPTSMQYAAESPLDRVVTCAANDSSMSQKFLDEPTKREEHRAEKSFWKRMGSKASQIFVRKPKTTKSIYPPVPYDRKKLRPPSFISRIFCRRLPEYTPVNRLNNLIGMKQTESCQAFGYHHRDYISTTSKYFESTEYVDPTFQSSFISTGQESLPSGPNLQGRHVHPQSTAWTMARPKRFSRSVPEGLNFSQEPLYMMRR